MRKVLAALAALAFLAACDSKDASPEALYGVWTHADSKGKPLWGTVEFTRNGRFALRGLKTDASQRSVDYSGSFKFLEARTLSVSVVGETGNRYEGELGYHISEQGEMKRLSLSLPGSVAGGRRAIFQKR